jgi:hypothetical protein
VRHLAWVAIGLWLWGGCGDSSGAAPDAMDNHLPDGSVADAAAADGPSSDAPAPDARGDAPGDASVDRAADTLPADAPPPADAPAADAPSVDGATCRWLDVTVCDSGQPISSFCPGASVRALESCGGTFFSPDSNYLMYLLSECPIPACPVSSTHVVWRRVECCQ